MRSEGRSPVASPRRGVFGEAFAIGMAVVHGMRITLINMFRKPVTVHYPTVQRPSTDRFARRRGFGDQ